MPDIFFTDLQLEQVQNVVVAKVDERMRPLEHRMDAVVVAIDGTPVEDLSGNVIEHRGGIRQSVGKIEEDIAALKNGAGRVRLRTREWVAVVVALVGAPWLGQLVEEVFARF